jgi:hypothetical protein
MRLYTHTHTHIHTHKHTQLPTLAKGPHVTGWQRSCLLWTWMWRCTMPEKMPTNGRGWSKLFAQKQVLMLGLLCGLLGGNGVMLLPLYVILSLRVML